MKFSADEVTRALGDGLLSFPITDFDEQGNFDPESYRQRLAWFVSHDISAIFVAGGTGELFIPFVDLRDRKAGYAVSPIKAGAEIIGRSAGRVRAPLSMPNESEMVVLKNLITNVGGS